MGKNIETGECMLCKRTPIPTNRTTHLVQVCANPQHIICNNCVNARFIHGNQFKCTLCNTHIDLSGLSYYEPNTRFMKNLKLAIKSHISRNNYFGMDIEEFESLLDKCLNPSSEAIQNDNSNQNDKNNSNNNNSNDTIIPNTSQRSEIEFEKSLAKKKKESSKSPLVKENFLLYQRIKIESKYNCYLNDKINKIKILQSENQTLLHELEKLQDASSKLLNSL